jgi:hypothetical protein
MTHGNTRILPIIMSNPKGHEDSIKDSRFKAAWQSGPTRTIRVLIALAELTLEYARKVGQVSNRVTQGYNLIAQLIAKLTI